MSDEKQKDTRSASQKIEDLEKAVMALYPAVENMSRDLLTIKDAIKLLGNKLDSVAKAAQIPDDTISKLMVENNVTELKSKVDDLVAKGILVPSQEVTAQSFVVGQEVDENGVVQNPRIQFTLSSLGEDLQAKIMAGKIGESISLQEGKLNFLITESYSIVAPQAPVAPVESAAPAPSEADSQQTSSTSENASTEAAAQ